MSSSIFRASETLLSGNVESNNVGSIFFVIPISELSSNDFRSSKDSKPFSKFFKLLSFQHPLC
ncbi:UNVERIFIED_CONTAM: hypothetical protein NCL1_12302 [Trichonephila clavipes]